MEWAWALFWATLVGALSYVANTTAVWHSTSTTHLSVLGAVDSLAVLVPGAIKAEVDAWQAIEDEADRREEEVRQLGRE